MFTLFVGVKKKKKKKKILIHSTRVTNQKLVSQCDRGFCLMTFAEGSWGLCLITNTLQVNKINRLILTHSKHMILQNIRFYNSDTWVIPFLTKLTCDKKYTCCKIIQKELFTHTVRKSNMMLLFGILMFQNYVSEQKSVKSLVY